MAQERIQRKLTTILAADVEGYTRLMRADEEATLKVLCAYHETIDGLISQHDGRIFSTGGDSVLAEFGSAVEAVRCAVGIQEALKVRNAELPVDRQLRFRIGINVGDVMVRDGDLFGDGVNVAARLEGLAEAGGICVSGSVFDQVRHKLSLNFEDMGAQEVKNIAEPVPAFRVVASPVSQTAPAKPRSAAKRWQFAALAVAVAVAIVVVGLAWKRPWVSDGEPPSIGKMASTLPEKPSIAVLPFTNMSGDKDQEYFSDGITEDIITDLSKVSSLFVIARNSTFTYKGRAVNMRQIAEELGVRYVLEGSVRKAGDRVRINAQLIDVSTGGHLWAERYDGLLSDVFDLQDKVTRKIVTALAISLTTTEHAQLANKGTKNPQAYDLFLRGFEAFNRYTREDNAEARRLFIKAAALDASYARALANVALTHGQDVLFQWTDDTQRSVNLGLEAVNKAAAQDDSIPQIYFSRAVLQLAQRKHSAAIASVKRAIELNPNYADGYALLAAILAWSGSPEEALVAIRWVKRLNPRYSFVIRWIEGHAKFLMGEYTQSIALLREVVRRNPAFDSAHLVLAAAYAHVGKLEEAKWEAEEVLVLRPNFSVGQERKHTRYRRARDLALYTEGLLKAGLPE